MKPKRFESDDSNLAVTIYVGGNPIRAISGQSVYAALLENGIISLRRSNRLKEPRGFFCGMGVCYECMVTINGQPNQQACMRTVEEYMEILIDDGDL